MSGKTHPNEPCGTPDAVYGTRFVGNAVLLTVDLPHRVLLLTQEQKTELIARLHQGMLAPMEWLFEQRWKAVFAGKPDGQGGVWPDQYQSIFERQSTGGIDGR